MLKAIKLKSWCKSQLNLNKNYGSDSPMVGKQKNNDFNNSDYIT